MPLPEIYNQVSEILDKFQQQSAKISISSEEQKDK